MRLWLDDFEEWRGLTLHLPAPWVSSCTVPRASGSDGTGRTMNALHAAFSRTLRTNTRVDIQSALLLDATLTSSAGFHARNALVAASDYLIAFTWGASRDQPKDGGTRHTWDLCRGHRIHVPLAELMAGKYAPPPRLTPLFKRVQKSTPSSSSSPPSSSSSSASTLENERGKL